MRHAPVPALHGVCVWRPGERKRRRLKRSAVEAHTITTGAIRAASFTAHESPQLTFEGIDDLLADLSKLHHRSQSSSFRHLLPAFVTLKPGCSPTWRLIGFYRLLIIKRIWCKGSIDQIHASNGSIWHLRKRRIFIDFLKLRKSKSGDRTYVQRQRLASPPAKVLFAQTTRLVQKGIGFVTRFRATVRNDKVDWGLAGGGGGQFASFPSFSLFPTKP